MAPPTQSFTTKFSTLTHFFFLFTYRAHHSVLRSNSVVFHNPLTSFLWPRWIQNYFLPSCQWVGKDLVFFNEGENNTLSCQSFLPKQSVTISLSITPVQIFPKFQQYPQSFFHHSKEHDSRSSHCLLLRMPLDIRIAVATAFLPADLLSKQVEMLRIRRLSSSGMDIILTPIHTIRNPMC